MLTAALFLLLAVLVGAGFLAVLLAMGATLMPDDVELPDTDPIDADRADLPYGGGWGA